ncbi:MAG: hypothetical protein ABW000_03160 [Actinoplanes sp.]
MIEELVRRAAADDEEAAEALETIADSEPERLTPHQGLMVDLDLLWPSKLFRVADAEAIRRIVEQVDGGLRPDQLGLNYRLLALAHSGHPLAEQALRRWETQPPPGADKLHVGPLSYAEEGGWTVDADGTRRELCGDIAYQLVLRETPGAADDARCPWCASPLWTVADLDTAEPAVAAALAHAGWSGRLVIKTCHLCSCHATLFSQVTPDGGTDWWAGNTRPGYYSPPADDPEDPPARLPVVGPAHPGPFQASAWGHGGSTLGGRPDWIQDAEHPGCPGCGRQMSYLGLIGGADLDDYGEGAYYLHLHQPCGYAAVNYQQS